MWKGQILICCGRSTRDDKCHEGTSDMEEYIPATDMWTVSQIRLVNESDMVQPEILPSSYSNDKVMELLSLK